MTSFESTTTYSLDFSDSSVSSHRCNAVNNLFSQRPETFNNSNYVPMIAKDSYGDWEFTTPDNKLRVNHPITQTRASGSEGECVTEEYDTGDGYELSVRCGSCYQFSTPTGHIKKTMIPEGVTLEDGKSKVYFVPSGEFSGRSLSNIFTSEKASDLASSSVHLRPRPIPPKEPTSFTAEPMTVKPIPGRLYFALSEDGSLDTKKASLERDIFMTVGTTGRVHKD